ncbi:hypothetical protein HanRHA438_Chr08g0328991 [Helianthus annuus]|nr:hypothetical protein HanRHA438_Chr08g0328991 [Helianthus annuus]
MVLYLFKSATLQVLTQSNKHTTEYKVFIVITNKHYGKNRKDRLSKTKHTGPPTYVTTIVKRVGLVADRTCIHPNSPQPATALSRFEN